MTKPFVRVKMHRDNLWQLERALDHAIASIENELASFNFYQDLPKVLTLFSKAKGVIHTMKALELVDYNIVEHVQMLCNQAYAIACECYPYHPSSELEAPRKWAMEVLADIPVPIAITNLGKSETPHPENCPTPNVCTFLGCHSFCKGDQS